MKQMAGFTRSSGTIVAAIGTLALCGGVCAGAAGRGGYSDIPRDSDGNSYKIGDAAQKDPAPAQDRARTEAIRVARIDYVSGKVTWRPDSHTDWATAKTNMALRQGAEIWAPEGARAEIRFSDGSLLRIGGGVTRLTALYTDEQGEFTGVEVLSGVVTIRPRQDRAVFEVTTPTLSVKTTGPSQVRVGVTEGTEVGVRRGRAVVEGSLGKTTLISGEFLSVRKADKEYVQSPLPSPDGWERWNDDRDRARYGADRSPYYRREAYAPSIWFSFDIPYYGRRFGGRHRW